MALISQKLSEIWQKMGQVLSVMYPEYVDNPPFLPPVNEERICEIEKKLGVLFPDEYRLSLKIHEGTVGALWLWDAIAISDLNVVLEDHAAYMKEVSYPNMQGLSLTATGPVTSKLFVPLWIPVATDNGIPICLDFAPARGGVVGQIIYVDMEDGTVKVIAKNFIEFLEAGLAKMASKI